MEQVLGWIGPVLAGFLLLSGLDDLFLAAVYFARRRGYEARFAETNPSPPEQPLAIWVPAWREEAVIERMLSANASSIGYRNAVFFSGVYPNDPATMSAVRAAAARHPNIVPCQIPHDGPTSKGDCLNWVYRRMLVWEQEHGVRFGLVLMHDAEDVIHPDEPAWVNRLAGEFAMVQTPVLAMPPGEGHGSVIYRTYCDDFAYFHSIELPARWMLGGFIPSAGVGTCYRRDLIERLARDSNQIFLPDALTEDYENGLRAAGFEVAQLFAPMRKGSNGDWIATREYFPATFAKARRQRTRWITGIGLQAWERRGWPLRHLYWLWRDRKGMLGSPSSLAANLMLIAGAALSATIPPPLLWSNLGVASAQCGLRIWAVARIYGWRMGLGTVPRIAAMNLLNAICVWSAIQQFAAAKLAGRPLRWVKTDHAYPSPSALGGNRKRIGEILCESGLLPQSAVEAAAREKPQGMRLGEYLVREGKLGIEELYKALGIQNGIESGSLRGLAIPRKLARLLPAGLMRELRVVPFAVDGGTLAVATAEVPGDEMMSTISTRVKIPVRFRLVPPPEITKIIDELL